ncbi:MAG: uridine kinase, partial [Cyanobacteria bacterium P01_F01_bin.143]
LYNKNLLKLYDFTVYIDTPADIRLGRRMIRDTTERGRSILDVYKQYIKTVRVMHKKYVEPCRSVADIIVSGEDGEEKVSVEQILKELKKKTINHI